MSRTARSGLMGLAALTAALGCSDGTDPFEDITGAYEATTFIVTPTGQTPVDVLAAGGSMTIALHEGGTTTGTFSVPASVAGEVILESMQGTFTVSGNTIAFDQAADTFIAEAHWVLGPDTISTTFISSDATIQVTLTRS